MDKKESQGSFDTTTTSGEEWDYLCSESLSPTTFVATPYFQPRTTVLFPPISWYLSASIQKTKVYYIIHVQDCGEWKQLPKPFRAFRHLYGQIQQLQDTKSFWGHLTPLNKIRFSKQLYSFQSSIVRRRQWMATQFLEILCSLRMPVPLGPVRTQVMKLLYQFLELERLLPQPLLYSSMVIVEDTPQSKLDRVITTIFVGNLGNMQQTCVEFCQAFGRNAQCNRLLTTSQALQQLNCIAERATMVELQLQQHFLIKEVLASTDTIQDSEAHHLMLVQLRRILRSRVEKELMVPLEDYIVECVTTLVPDEAITAIQDKILLLQRYPASYFGIPSASMSQINWSAAQQAFQLMNHYTVPMEKLQCLITAANALSSHSLTCADELLPIHIYFIVHYASGLALRTKEYVWQLCNNATKTAELGYFLTMFEAALEFIRTCNLPLAAPE